MPRCSSLPLLLLLAAPFALVERAAAQEEQFGTVKTFEASAEGGILVLSGGVHYGVPKAVYEANRELFNGLKEGASVAYVLDKTGAVASIREVVREDEGARQRVYSGKLVKVEQIGDMYWLFMDEFRWPMALEVYTKSELPFMKRGNALRVVVEKGRVIEVARGALTEDTIKPEHWDRIQRSQRNDDVFVNGRAYKFVDSDLQSIRVSPKLPDGTHLGIETIKLEDVKSFQNQAADARLGSGGSSGQSGGDSLDQADVRLGDTLGLGLDSGQVVTLTEDTCELRVWRNETWGPARSWKRSELNGPVRRVSLSSQATTQLPGGEVHLRVHRSRHAAKGGLVFEVEVDHDLSDKVMVGAHVKFHLGGLTMSPGAPSTRTEDETVPVLFAGQQARIVHRVNEEGFMDGWAEIALPEGAIVPLASPGAKAHLIAAICAEPADLNELTKVYEAAGGNGDEDLLRILVERALYPPKGGPIEAPKHAEAALAGLERAGEKASRLIVGDLFFLDRNLKRATLQRTGELIYEPLNRMNTEPAAYKRSLALLLGRLPGSLKGELGQRVFTLCLDREDLNEPILRAFRARPAEAMETLLSVATSTHAGSSPDEVRRAEAAAAMLRRIGEPVMDEMLRELRKRDISATELQAQAQQPSAAPGEIIDKALALLVADVARRRRAQLDLRVKAVTELEGQGKWAEALQALREVLAQDSGHEGALEHIPVVMVSLARERRAEDRGQAARLLAEASQLLPAAKKTLANAPLAEIYLEAAREDAEGVVARAGPQTGAARLSMIPAGTTYSGKVADTEWVEVELGADKKGYLRLKAVRETEPGRWTVQESDSPREMVVEVLDQVRKLSPALESQANQVEGELLARDAAARYEAGDFHGALPLFERARSLAPTDPRLSLESSAWMKAHLAYLLAVGAVVLVGVGVGVMQLFSRPRKVKFTGEFRHYGANRSARERDLDLGEEGAAPPPAEGGEG